MSWQFATAGRLVFGRGVTGELGSLVARLKLQRVLLVTDANLVAAGMATRIVEQLQSAACSVVTYDECRPEPPVQCAVDAAALAVQHQVDGIVALGGGSNIDIAKMVAILKTHGGKPQDYFGFDRVPGPLLPLIACPTTAGTGSEVSNSSVLTDHDSGTKVSSLSHYLRPALAVVDPDLTDTCPAKVSAHSGIDALVHAIEAITARASEVMPAPTQLERAYAGAYGLTSMLGLEAVRLIGKSLVKAVHTGSDRQAREDMALAATLAGMAFSNSGVALVHALEYPIGVLTHCSHGEGNGLLLPHVMRFNLGTRVRQFARIAAALDGQVLNEQLGESELNAQAERSIQVVVELQSALGIRRHFASLA